MEISSNLLGHKALLNQAKQPDSREIFVDFVKNLVKSEAKIVFQGLADEGVQAGKKDIDRSIRKIIKKVVAGDKNRHRMDPKSQYKIKAFIKGYLIQKFLSPNT